ncbi:MAG TPA: hypothetical protein VLL48_10305, partial [Longimicrobiales bacterium]|nr:hypothetical protein [Longimicrobiales bacterium]
MSASPAQGRAVRGYGIARSRRAVAVAVAVALALATALAATPERAAPQGTLRLVAYNVKHGQGMDGVVDLRRAARVLRELDPDVVTLQEIDRGVDRTGGVDQARRLGELL